jgi:hypothetical protein
VIGGSLLLDSIRSMTGHRAGGATGLADPAAAAGHDAGSPWGNSAGGDLARQAGLDEVGNTAAGASPAEGRGLFDHAAHDATADDYSGDELDADFDDGFDGGDFGSDQ